MQVIIKPYAPHYVSMFVIKIEYMIGDADGEEYSEHIVDSEDELKRWVTVLNELSGTHGVENYIYKRLPELKGKNMYDIEDMPNIETILPESTILFDLSEEWGKEPYSYEPAKLDDWSIIWYDADGRSFDVEIKD